MHLHPFQVASKRNRLGKILISPRRCCSRKPHDCKRLQSRCHRVAVSLILFRRLSGVAVLLTSQLRSASGWPSLLPCRSTLAYAACAAMEYKHSASSLRLMPSIKGVAGQDPLRLIEVMSIAQCA